MCENWVKVNQIDCIKAILILFQVSFLRKFVLLTRTQGLLNNILVDTLHYA